MKFVGNAALCCPASSIMYIVISAILLGTTLVPHAASERQRLVGVIRYPKHDPDLQYWRNVIFNVPPSDTTTHRHSSIESYSMPTKETVANQTTSGEALGIPEASCATPPRAKVATKKTATKQTTSEEALVTPEADCAAPPRAKVATKKTATNQTTSEEALVTPEAACAAPPRANFATKETATNQTTSEEALATPEADCAAPPRAIVATERTATNQTTSEEALGIPELFRATKETATNQTTSEEALATPETFRAASPKVIVTTANRTKQNCVVRNSSKIRLSTFFNPMW